MSWFFNSLTADDDPQAPPPQPPNGAGSGVQEDLSAITQSIGRQLRGFAAFIAPPPQSGADSAEMSEKQSSAAALDGIRNDLEEIGGSFKSGFSLLSTNSHRAVTEISKLASDFLSFQEEEEEDEDDDDDDGNDNCVVAGITDEIFQFVSGISKRPECWTDFPLSLDDHDFIMSDAMREHASTIEDAILDFAALRQRLCNSMKEEKFWMIYFILLVPRLHGHDLELLSTSKILEARDVLLRKIESNRNAETSDKSFTSNESLADSRVSERQVDDDQYIEKEVSTDSRELDILDETSTKQWLDKANIGPGDSMDAQRKLESEESEEISFSDLEDDDNDLSNRASDFRQAVENLASCGASDWVKLSGSSSEIQIWRQKSGLSKDKDSEEESSDWLTVDDFD